MTYNQDFKDGYGPHDICIQCKVTNDAAGTFQFSIEQTPLNCDAILSAKAGAPASFTFDYVSAGAGHTYDFTLFYDYNQIEGCILDCNFGTSCGSGAGIASSFVSKVATAAYEPYATAAAP